MGLADSLYMTSVRVEGSRAAEWDDFYDAWTRAFTTEVPGCSRGSRWRVLDGVADGAERLPPAGWPVYQAIFEHQRIDHFVVSRSYRGTPKWQPRARAFDPWFRSLRDYATLHLQRLGVRPAGPGELAPVLFTALWTVDQDRALAAEGWYEREVLAGLQERLRPIAAHRYLATLAHLHRYGDEEGKLVIPLRLHFEERGSRLCYATILELEALPGDRERGSVLDWLDRAIGSMGGRVGDRHEAFATSMSVLRAG